MAKAVIDYNNEKIIAGRFLTKIGPVFRALLPEFAFYMVRTNSVLNSTAEFVKNETKKV